MNSPQPFFAVPTMPPPDPEMDRRVRSGELICEWGFDPHPWRNYIIVADLAPDALATYRAIFDNRESE